MSVLFVCMLFAGTAAVGAVALLTLFSTAPLPPPDVARALAALGYALVFVFGVRAAGMYMITTTGLASGRRPPGPAGAAELPGGWLPAGQHDLPSRRSCWCSPPGCSW